MYSRLSSPSKQTKTSVKEAYPEDIQCVRDSISGVGGIYISNLEAAQNLKTLNRLGIKAVITAASGACLGHSRSDIPYYKYIPGEDHENYNLARYFEDSVQFLQENLKRTNVLVHCMAGISRSATLVLAYLIKSEGIDYEKAFSLTKNRRRIIRPNNGFVRQLKNFELEVRSMNRSLSPEKAYATDQRRYRTPETRYTTINANPEFDSTTKTNNSKFVEQASTKTYSSTNTKRWPTYLTTCSDIDMSNEQEIDLKISEIRKKYALPERKHSVFLEKEQTSSTRSPLNSSDRNTNLFKSGNNWTELKSITDPYVSKRLKTSQRYENQMENNSLKQPALKSRRTMFELGIGIGLPVRKKITMDEHKYMIGRY